jgi:hypothetical protein
MFLIVRFVRTGTGYLIGNDVKEGSGTVINSGALRRGFEVMVA